LLSTKRQDVNLYFARNQTSPVVFSSVAFTAQVLLTKETHSTSPSRFPVPATFSAPKVSRSTVESQFESKRQPRIAMVSCRPT
jgi:hypothetical protein